MKKQFCIFVVMALAAHTIMGSGFFYGGYGSNPYQGFQFPDFGNDEDGQGQMPGQPTQQQPQQPEQPKPEPQKPQTFEQQFPRLILIFTKDECGYCRYMKPIMERMAAKFGEGTTMNITFKIVDVGENPQYAKQYGFETVPQIIYFKEGQPLEMHGSGNKTMTDAQVEAKINAHFGEAPTAPAARLTAE